MKVYVAVWEHLVLGVYSSFEKAKARCDEWISMNHEATPWMRQDGAWQRSVREEGVTSWERERITECEVE